MPSPITALLRINSYVNAAKNALFDGKHSQIGDLVIDASMNETIEYKSVITEHPIETKETISDYIYKQPLRVQINGLITDSPMKTFGILEYPLSRNTPQQILNNITSLIPFTNQDKPSNQAFEILTKLYNDRKPITVVTSFKSFDDMAINSITFDRDNSKYGYLSFTAELLQINYATVITTANISNTKLRALTSNKTQGGDALPVQVQKPQALKSWSASIVDSISEKWQGVENLGSGLKDQADAASKFDNTFRP